MSEIRDGYALPVDNQITTHFSCKKCLESVPFGESPKSWARLDVGMTSKGLQVWCLRHKCNVVHIDFLGQRLPANVATRGKQ